LPNDNGRMTLAEWHWQNDIQQNNIEKKNILLNDIQQKDIW